MRRAWLLSVALLAGCATSPPQIIYQPVPEGLLEHCSLPSVAGLSDTYDLEDAFIVAYQCAERGNSDKDKIRALPGGGD